MEDWISDWMDGWMGGWMDGGFDCALDGGLCWICCDWDWMWDWRGVRGWGVGLDGAVAAVIDPHVQEYLLRVYTESTCHEYCVAICLGSTWVYSFRRLHSL